MPRSALATPAPYSEDTGPRIYAYLASMRPMEGCEGILELDNYQRGRALIERMASTVRGDGRPRLKLTSTDCADVLAFMHFSEPVNSRTWWFDPKGQPSHLVGYYLVVQTVEAALRKAVLP